MKRCYLIGIKGVGMTALAIYLKQSGWEVTGADVGDVFITDKLLEENGIKIFKNFDARNLSGEHWDLVIASAAYNDENVEIAEAKKRKLNLKLYSEVLGEISANKKVVAVAGVHGKTTTTALISFIFEKANLDPCFIIGSGEVPNFSANAKKGDGDYFIVEADEYRKSPIDNTPKFLDLNPYVAIISSIELDHPDVFESVEDIYQAFYKLVCKVPRNGHIILCSDYPKAKKLETLIADRNFETYGFSEDAKWHIDDIEFIEEKTKFTLAKDGKKIGQFAIKLPGKHNILNATAAIITSILAGIEVPLIQEILPNFLTVKRRFEKIGEIEKTVIIDDYAHHPTAIAKTIEAAKLKYPNKKVAVIFQPHTYSRTEKLINEFAESFRGADEIFILDIFASAREQKGKVTSEDLVLRMKALGLNALHIKDWQEIRSWTKEKRKDSIVILTVGAGDIYKLANIIKSDLAGEIVG